MRSTIATNRAIVSEGIWGVQPLRAPVEQKRFIANGLIEGINSLVQAAKAKARGYRSTRTLKAITYLIAGKLDLRLPT
jgi:hypothetical protein